MKDEAELVGVLLARQAEAALPRMGGQPRGHPSQLPPPGDAGHPPPAHAFLKKNKNTDLSTHMDDDVEMASRRKRKRKKMYEMMTMKLLLPSPPSPIAV